MFFEIIRFEVPPRWKGAPVMTGKEPHPPCRLSGMKKSIEMVWQQGIADIFPGS
jgi:hypothetical protein